MSHLFPKSLFDYKKVKVAISKYLIQKKLQSVMDLEQI